MKNIKNIINIFLILIILLSSFCNISFATNQKISEDINNIDVKKYPGIKEEILKLKNKHPNWNFKILYTDLEWKDVIENEYYGHGSSPRNLISYKENYQGNWICPICGNRPYDNGSWRCASKEAISYMIDPRNSLNDLDIFQFEQLTSKSSNINIVKEMIKDTFLENHEKGIVEIANQNGVNSYYIVARLLQEQGKKGSELVSGKTGYYNAFNIGASGNTPEEIIKNGIEYAKNEGWNTLEKSISGGIGFVTNQYIKKGQNTLYLQKFNVTNNGTYWRQYQQNLMAAQKEGETLRNIYIDTNSFESNHTFIIPVYKNMKVLPAPRPDGSQKPNTEAELVRVNVDNSLKIRRTPEDSNAIGWLWKDEIVTRLEKATKKINGTYWDKIRKSNGLEGYTARETFESEPKYKLYLVPIKDENPTPMPTPEPKPEEKNSNGDVDNDKKITANDYMMIKNHIMEIKILSEEQKKRADYDNDKKVTANDYMLIKKYIMDK